MSWPVTRSGGASWNGLVGSPLKTTKLVRPLLQDGDVVVSTTLTVMLAPALVDTAKTGRVMPECGGMSTSRAVLNGDGAGGVTAEGGGPGLLVPARKEANPPGGWLAMVK